MKSEKDKSKEKEVDTPKVKIEVNKMGQIERGFDVDAVNDFLNKKVKDKKLEK